MRRSAFLSLVVLSLLAASARADSFAPLERPGPPLSVPPGVLAASLQCQPGVQSASVAPVLLNPATGVTPDQNFSWNYERSLSALGIPWCAYTAPFHTLGDIQTSGEYLVYAIRTMYAMAHRKIDIMGHSQGGMSMRWALRFWPDTRAMVDDVVGFSGTNHGTTVAGGSCGAGCPPADFQQGANANFLQALNSYAESFPGISYTNIFTHTDEVVQPNSGPNASAALHTGGGQITNVATQDVCPLDVNEHLNVGTIDAVAYALAIDALSHPGPADPARISSAVCTQPYQPGVDPASANTYIQILAAQPGLLAVDVPGFNVVGAPEVRAEPDLRCYVFASCSANSAAALGPPGASGAAAPAAGARECSRPSLSFAIHQNNGRVTRVLVYLNGRRVLSRRGRRITRVSLRRPARASYTLRVVDYTARRLRVSTTRRYAGCSKTKPRLRVRHGIGLSVGR